MLVGGWANHQLKNATMKTKWLIVMIATLCSVTAWAAIIQQAYIKASNTDVGDQFGIAVAIAGDTLVVTANLEASKATGINGDQTDNSAYNAGAAYVFVRDGDNWSQQAYLKASNTESGDNMYHVAVNGDTVVLAAVGEDSGDTGVNGDQADNTVATAGAAYVFVRSGTNWSQQAYLKASNTGTNDQFGSSVSISGDTLAVGANGEASNAKGVNGNQTNNNASFAGAVYVFVRTGTNWTQQAYLKASNSAANDNFGWSVALSGDTLVVGAPREDSNATGVNGNQNDNNAIDSGAAYVFVRNGTNWSQQAYLKAANTGDNDWFGYSVAISGDTILVGDPLEDSNGIGVNGDDGNNFADNSGAAYVFVRSDTNWRQQAFLKPSNTDAGDNFGRSVSVSDDIAAVGTCCEGSVALGVNGNTSDNSLINAGAAYVFVRTGTNWNQQAYLKPSNTSDHFDFGYSVSVSGETVVTSAFGDRSSATGVNDSQSDDGWTSAGAAYVFTGFAPPPPLSLVWSNNEVQVSWPLAAEGFVLEEADALQALSPTSWIEVPPPYQTNASRIFVTLPQSSDSRFYRLRK